MDLSHRDDFVDVNLDIVFSKIPCDVLSLDVKDILGTMKTDVMGDNMFKHRISEKGEILSTENMNDKNQFRGAIKERV